MQPRRRFLTISVSCLHILFFFFPRPKTAYHPLTQVKNTCVKSINCHSRRYRNQTITLLPIIQQIRCHLIYIEVQPVCIQCIGSISPCKLRYRERIIIYIIIDRKWGVQSLIQVMRSYSGWPWTKICFPSRLITRNTPASSDSARMTSSGCFSISSLRTSV